MVPAYVPAADVSPDGRRAAEEPPTFGLIWSQHVEPLTGQTLHRGNGRSNTILAVDGGGLVRRTSNGQKQRIDIEVFRWTIERLLCGETVLRTEINAQCIGRVSSGVILILSSPPMFELTNQARSKDSRCESIEHDHAKQLRPGRHHRAMSAEGYG